MTAGGVNGKHIVKQPPVASLAQAGFIFLRTFAFANRCMGKSKNKKLPAVAERFPLWTLGLPFAEYHGIDEVNEKLKLQAWMVDGIYGDEDEVKLWYCTSEFGGGFYIFVMKGSLDIRLRTLGVGSPGQKDLSGCQLLLRLVAKIQMGCFTEGQDWRMVTTITGTYHWGPERPSFANGAVVYLHPRDCPTLEEWCRTKQVTLQSKHAVVSAEYMPLFGAALRESEKCVPPCPDDGRQRFMTRRASTVNELSWFAAPEYVERLMRVDDMESHQSLSFEGSDWLIREPGKKEQEPGKNGQAKVWMYLKQRYRVESWAGTYLTVSMRF